MGGAAVNGIIAAGAVGGGVLLSTTATGMLLDGAMDKGDQEKLLELFQKVCRTSNGLEDSSSEL